MKTRVGIFMIFVAGLAVASAAQAQQRPRPVPPRAPSKEEQEAVQRGMEALFKALGEQQQQAPAALVDHRELKALLPAEVKGMKRASASSEKSGAMGMAIARAEARFENGDRSIEIEILDTGGLGSIGAMSHATWTSVEIDRETDTGFERTVQYRGFKAMEQYDRQNRTGSIQVLVGGRFIVKAEGSEVPIEAIRAALDAVDLKKLAALKPAASAQ